MHNFKAIIFDLDDTLYSTENRLDAGTPNFADMKLFDGVQEILRGIKSKKILLTHGVKEIQEKKIATLDIRNLFDEIIIVASNTDKLPIFEKMKSEFQNPKDVAVVGDRRDIEIRFGNMMGFITIFIHGFKYKDLAPKDDMEIPSFEIKEFRELTDIL